MAERPIFVPTESGSKLVMEIPVSFTWHPGMAPTQKKKNVIALHESAARKGLSPLLEISSKSEEEVGRRLSAFSLKLHSNGHNIPVECAYQGSKVFENGGPFTDLFFLTSREAKRDSRLRESGRLRRFHFEDRDYPLSPPTAFYDWIYIRALYPFRDWLVRFQQCAGFTDIEFNPERSLNCQARSFAEFISLQKRQALDDVADSFETFSEVLQSGSL